MFFELCGQLIASSTCISYSYVGEFRSSTTFRITDSTVPRAKHSSLHGTRLASEPLSEANSQWPGFSPSHPRGFIKNNQLFKTSIVHKVYSSSMVFIKNPSTWERVSRSINLVIFSCNSVVCYARTYTFFFKTNKQITKVTLSCNIDSDHECL